MPHGIQVLINTISLIIGFAFILWGLKIFKIYIILTGIAIGSILGAIIGGLISKNPDGFIIGGLIGAIFGGLIAWPLQKLLVFIIGGFFSGLLCVLVLSLLGASTEIWPLIIFISIIGGILSVYFYQIIIIILMAFNGAQTIFNLSMGERSAFSNISFTYDYFEVWEELINMYSQYICAFLFTSIIFILFALYFQRKLAIKQKDGEKKKLKKIYIRKFTYLLSFLTVLGYVLSNLLGDKFTSYTLFGLSTITWPIIAIIMTYFILWLIFKGNKIFFFKSLFLSRISFIILFILIVFPLIHWISSIIFYLNVLIPNLKGAHIFNSVIGWFTWYYKAFYTGSVLSIIAKWFSALIFLPGLLYLTAFSDSLVDNTNNHISEITQDNESKATDEI